MVHIRLVRNFAIDKLTRKEKTTKKTLLIALALLMGMVMMADEITMNEIWDEERLGQHKSPALLPTVDYEDLCFTITPPYTIYNVEIVIKDDDGNVLYEETVNEIDGSYCIYVLSTVASEMHSIELVYSNHHLFGICE